MLLFQEFGLVCAYLLIQLSAKGLVVNLDKVRQRLVPVAVTPVVHILIVHFLDLH